MKRFFYSPYTKAIAVILFVLAIAMSVFFAGNNLAAVNDGEEPVYEFEDNFSESRHLAYLLTEPESMVANAYLFFYGSDMEKTIVDGEIIVDGMTFTEYLESTLPIMYHIEKIDYLITINDTVLTNCDLTEEDLKNREFYRCTSREKNNGSLSLNVETSSGIADPHDYYNIEEISSLAGEDSIVIISAVKDDYAAACEILWEEQAAIVKETVMQIFIYGIFALILLCYLIAVAGKTEHGKIKTNLIDEMWTEIHLFLFFGGGVALIAAIWWLLEAYFIGQIPFYLMRLSTVSIAAAGSLLLLAVLLSMIRKLKDHTFLKTSVIFRVLHWIWTKIFRLFGSATPKGKEYINVIQQALGKKSGRFLIAMLFIYTSLIGLFGVMTPSAGFPSILGILLFGVAAYVLVHRSKDLDNIKNGANAIRNGNLQYKIEDIKSEDLKELAQDINEITDGLDRSIAEKLKAERMKTELITNVSHDLKTPLTSIINYTTLLSEMEDLPEEAGDYIAIIAKKSEGLKNLTHDLFDISKVQSGNETFAIEKLDAAQLIEQSIGEHNSEIQNTELDFCVRAEKDLWFMADGRKMSRVLGNLIENALRYSMKNTRVFLETFEKDGEVVIEIKNISAEPMDFDAEEITARFVRGDSSRTDGGNGLGLAIAKSYTEACGGTFRITIDGDLFKATITFPKK